MSTQPTPPTPTGIQTGTPGSTPAVTPTAVEQLATLFGVPLATDEYEQVARVLTVLLESIAELDRVDLTAVEPASVFDARWDA